MFANHCYEPTSIKKKIFSITLKPQSKSKEQKATAKKL